LYNGWVGTNSRNICPIGWHVPTISDWNVLQNYLGGSEVAGGKLKAADGWDPPNFGATNSSGFTGLPGGGRVVDSSDFSDLNSWGWWWSSTAVSSSNNALHFNLIYSSNASSMLYLTRRAGMSLRCVLD
jgi:uncharacterized protein (TIGR02145 family)